MIPLAACKAIYAPNGLKEPIKSPKLPLTSQNLNPHLTYGLRRPAESAPPPNGILIRSAVLQSTSV